MAQYFAGRWNGHTIIAVNQDAEKLVFDDQVLVQNKPGICLGTAMTAPIPGTDGLYVYTMLVSNLGVHCSCIIGKPLETTHEKKIYAAEYNGHKIEAINKLKAVLLVDGKEVDKQDSLFESFLILGAKAEDSDKRYMAVFDGISSLSIKCTLYAEAENVVMSPCRVENGQLIPMTMAEIDEELQAITDDEAAAIAALTTIAIID